MNRLIDFSSRFRILKGGKISLVVSALLGSVVIASAAPTGGVVTSGNATISSSGNVTNIDQSTQKASINWTNFSVTSKETVNFNQPNSSSITLNRVVGTEKSVIDGALNANGQVWILNSNGILFGKNSSINTSGLIATTAELSDQDFQAGNYDFKNSSSNSVINLGTIKVNNSSYVVLAGKEVENGGNIEAVKGKVHLAGANEYSINLNGNSLVNLRINKGVLDAMVSNSGNILANGGEIFLTTNAVDELLKGVVNNTGIIEANSLDGITGKVELFAHGGTANVGGTIDASAPVSGDGGFIETSGKEVNIKADAKITTKSKNGKTGTWLIDPNDYTVASSGGNITGTQLSSDLENNNIEIRTATQGTSGGNGDIFVNDNVTWTSGNTLTLTAERNININSTLDASAGNGGKVVLNYGQGSSDGIINNTEAKYSFGLTSNGFTGKINLQAGQNFSTKLGANGTPIDWIVLNDYNSLQNIQSGTKYALGANIDASGINHMTLNNSTTLDGLGHTISNLGTSQQFSYMGSALFDRIYSGDIVRNLGLININNSGSMMMGTGGVSNTNDGIIDSVYVTGTIGMMWNNNYMVGGITGYNNGTISNSFTNVTASGDFEIGGIAGENYGTIKNVYALGSVNGMDYLGGLVGYNGGTISNSYSISTIVGQYYGTSGGLVGYNYGTITSSYYDKTVNSGMNDENSYGKTTTQMQTLSTYIGWDITGSDGAYPTFSSSGWYMNGTTPSVISISYTLSDILSGYTYSGNEVVLNSLWSASDIFGSTYSSWILGTDYSFVYGGNTITSFTNAGTYSNIGIDILKSGYSEATSGNTNGKLTIEKADAIVTANSNTVTYNGSTQNVNGFTASGLVGNEDESVLTGITGAIASGKNVGEYATTLDGTDGNYNLRFVDGTLTITPKAIIVSANNLNKISGNIDPTLTYSITGLVSGNTQSGSLSREKGELAGTYKINQGTLTAGSNYTITFNDGVFTIIPDVVTPIANTTVTTPKVNVVVPPQVPFTTAPTFFNNGTPVNLVSAPIQNQPTRIVSLSQINSAGNGGQGTSSGTNDIRVPVGGSNSILQIVNNGQNLPGGVDQLLFVVNGNIPANQNNNN